MFPFSSSRMINSLLPNSSLYMPMITIYIFANFVLSTLVVIESTMIVYFTFHPCDATSAATIFKFLTGLVSRRTSNNKLAPDAQRGDIVKDISRSDDVGKWTQEKAEPVEQDVDGVGKSKHISRINVIERWSFWGLFISWIGISFGFLCVIAF